MFKYMGIKTKAFNNFFFLPDNYKDENCIFICIHTHGKKVITNETIMMNIYFFLFEIITFTMWQTVDMFHISWQ